MVNRILQVMLTAVVVQLHHANGGMFCDESIEEIIPAKQRMLAIGNQQCGFNLAGIGVQFTTLMAEQRQHRRNAQFQQREKVIYNSATLPSCTSAVSPGLMP